MQAVLGRWNARRSSAVPPELIGRIAPTYRGHQLARRVPLPDRAVCRATAAVIAGGEISRWWPLRRPDTPGKTISAEEQEHSANQAPGETVREIT
jgi:hypothetical protein